MFFNYRNHQKYRKFIKCFISKLESKNQLKLDRPITGQMTDPIVIRAEQPTESF